MTESKYFEFLEKYHIEGNIGINEKEIIEIEEKFKLKLPRFYKDFLKLFGCKTGNILTGYYMTYPSLIKNRDDAIYELNFDDRSHNKIGIKDSYFFFAQWQGYNFYFFDCHMKNNNKKIYLFDGIEIKEAYKDFKEFIKKNIKKNEIRNSLNDIKYNVLFT
ncbi:SMI1/KNR4 family protein [Tenacibaculum finnmarkense]|uniref:SMI1/KNR4 family protein n=1 Tax=Tenacibaculum finnmarkense TaxID=2781243 RepID=UPI001E444B06|nr:SMI1/KNR4 family protein [Tenacibaculum finnmarkense]MCD8413578.1 SMI1/KNR4 family protein [Tenacibaculum finnmarkense genomovar ulcerans]